MEQGKNANQLGEIRKLWDGMKGHNYGLPDSVKFILERIGRNEKRPDFWDIAALTGDTVSQVYNHNLTTRCEYCVSGYLAGAEHIAYVFDTLGYDHEYTGVKKMIADMAFYQQKIMEYIDKGIPILVKANIADIPGWKSDVGTYPLVIGYENGGQILKMIVCNSGTIDYEMNEKCKLDLVFIGERKREVSLEELYLSTVRKMSHWLRLPERDGMFFGAAAYRVWADDIESGRFEDESIALWDNYGVYVCNLATSGGLPAYILRKLAEKNPVYSELAHVGEKIHTLLPSESPTGGKSLLWVQLEELGGGMDMKAVRLTMRDKQKRAKVAAALRNYADRLDQAVELLHGVETIV